MTEIIIYTHCHELSLNPLRETELVYFFQYFSIFFLIGLKYICYSDLELARCLWTALISDRSDQSIFYSICMCEFYKVWFLLVSGSCSVSIWGECLDLMCLSRSLRLTRILPHRSHLKQQYYFIWQIVSVLHSDPSAWRKGAQLLPLFHFTVCRAPHVLVQYISPNISFLRALAIFKVVGNGFIWLADRHHI